METGLNTKVWEKITQISYDLFCAIDRNGTFLEINESSKKILGYDTQDLIGRNYQDFVFPGDLIKTQLTTEQVINGTHTINFENRLVHKCGLLVSILWSALWSEEDQMVYAMGRDITDSRQNQLDLRISEKRYKALFNDNPDLIFLEDKDGFIIEANQSFCTVFGVTLEEAIGSHIHAFLPQDMISFCDAALHQAILGNTMRLDLELITAKNERRIYDTIKQPITINGTVDCVQTIAKDISPIVRSYNTIKQQTQKLNTIFESITDCFVMLDRNWNFVYINKAANELLGLDPEYFLEKNAWQELPHAVNGEMYNNYHLAVDTGKVVHFETYYKEVNLWLEIKAFPSEEGLSIYFNDISEEIKSRQQLEKMSLVASKTTNSAIIMDGSGRIEWVNEGFNNLTGYILDEVIGKRPYEILAGEESDPVSLNYIAEKMDHEDWYRVEVLFYKKSGEKRWFDIEGTPVFDEHGKITNRISIHTDVTDRVRSNQELAKLSLVASKTNNSVIIADKNWRIEWVNEGFTKLMGYTLAEALGNRPSQFLRNVKTDRNTFDKLESRLLKGEAISFEVLNVTKSDKEVWLNIEISPVVNEKGELTRFIEIQTDITALQNSKIELSTLAKDLYIRNNDLQQFTYIVSHNLRSPVANTLGLTNLLVTAKKDSELFDTLLGNLQQSVLQIDTVLRDMNKILSIRDSKYTLEKELVNLNEVFGQVLISLHNQLQKANCEIINELPKNLTVKGFKAYIYSIFYNLLSNSIKYRSEERPLKVQIQCVSDCAIETRFSFSDNGSGFDMEKAKTNIFKLYKRFHPNKEGSGIGLYLIKTHLDVMGGAIKVDSKVGVGTRFQISLPKL